MSVYKIIFVEKNQSWKTYTEYMEFENDDEVKNYIKRREKQLYMVAQDIYKAEWKPINF